MKITRTLIPGIALILAGCGQPPPPQQTPTTKPAPAPRTEKGTMQTAIEGFTGKAAVDSGIQAKARIKAISEQEKKDLDEVMP